MSELDNMNLEDLKKAKKEIEQRIRELGHQTITYHGAKLDKEHYPTEKPDEWGIYVWRRFDEDLCRRNQWQSVIRTTDRKKCIDLIPQLISDLQGLYDKLTEGENAQKD